MSTSDPDPARAPRASEHSPDNPTPTGRFQRSAGERAGQDGTTPRVAAADAPESAYPRQADAWSHEVGARRFEPTGPRGEYPADATIYRPNSGRPEHNEPSIAMRAFEETVPPPAIVDRSRSASAFVTDALGELTADDQSRAAAPPRRAPGSPSTPPPGFGRS